MAAPTVSNIKTSPLEDYGDGREEPPCPTATVRTGNWGVLVKASLQLKSRWAAGALVFVDRQIPHLLRDTST